MVSELIQSKDIVNVKNKKTIYVSPSEKEEKMAAFLVLIAITIKHVAEEDRILLAEKSKEEEYEKLKLKTLRDSWLYYLRTSYRTHFILESSGRHRIDLVHHIAPMYRNSLLQECYEAFSEAISDYLFRGAERILVLEKEYKLPDAECKFFFCLFCCLLICMITVITGELRDQGNNKSYYGRTKEENQENEENNRKPKRAKKDRSKLRHVEASAKAKKSSEKVVVRNDAVSCLYFMIVLLMLMRSF